MAEKPRFTVDEVLNFLDDDFSQEDSDDYFDGSIDSESEVDKLFEAEKECEADAGCEASGECERNEKMLSVKQVLTSWMKPVTKVWPK